MCDRSSKGRSAMRKDDAAHGRKDDVGSGSSHDAGPPPLAEVDIDYQGFKKGLQALAPVQSWLAAHLQVRMLYVGRSRCPHEDRHEGIETRVQTRVLRNASRPGPAHRAP
eukprot:scaffold34887_cov61-Phaeocystis_antarctica.AAC.3